MDRIDETQRIRRQKMQRELESVDEALSQNEETYDLSDQQQTELNLLADTLGIDDHQY